MMSTSFSLSRLGGLALSATLLLAALPAHAETFQVKMLNRNSTGPMVYEPEFLKVKPGDTVKFLATTNGHNAASIDGMLPAGAQPFKGKMDMSSIRGGCGSLISHYSHGLDCWLSGTKCTKLGFPQEFVLPENICYLPLFGMWPVIRWNQHSFRLSSILNIAIIWRSLELFLLLPPLPGIW